MNQSVINRIRLFIPALLVYFIFISASSVEAAGGRDLLWDIIANCINTSAADYCSVCRWPRTDSTCAQTTSCKHTTDVWAETDSFVVLRDVKMCDCPDGFVHGLALPRSRVTGVEDPKRPVGIWKFAWDSATSRIKDTSSIALVANPPGGRSQDQLHIHLVRMNGDALQFISAQSTDTVMSLDDVWKVAEKRAIAQKFDEYGVLVYKRRDGGYTVLVDKENPEKKYTQYRCH